MKLMQVGMQMKGGEESREKKVEGGNRANKIKSLTSMV
jgi:hypothetical protein